MRKISVSDIAVTIDHSLLRPDLKVKELVEGCALAREYSCVSVCIYPAGVEMAAMILEDTDVLVTTVASFPHGTATIESKVYEAADSVAKGAVEVDMVMNYARLLSGDYSYVEKEIAAVARAVHQGGAELKVIFENYYLSDEQIVKSCGICKAAGADFIKTSTGYAPGGAAIPDLKLMVAHSEGMKVKAAGGVKTLDEALAIIATGTVRIGTRSSKEILEEAAAREKRGELFLEE